MFGLFLKLKPCLQINLQKKKIHVFNVMLLEHPFDSIFCRKISNFQFKIMLISELVTLKSDSFN